MFDTKLNAAELVKEISNLLKNTKEWDSLETLRKLHSYGVREIHCGEYMASKILYDSVYLDPYNSKIKQPIDLDGTSIYGVTIRVRK